MPSSVRIDVVSENVAHHTQDVIRLYRRVYSGAPYFYDAADFDLFETTYWRHQIAEPGFVLTLAWDNEAIIGMAYGWTFSVASKSARLLSLHLDNNAVAWLDNCFIFAELSVVPSWRRRGVATALHDQLLKATSHISALLYVLASDQPVIRFYRKLGWSILAKKVSQNSDRHYHLMGRRLSSAEDVPKRQ
ncbi:GNAT family N-acetyltransferase [Leisingera caerulea]|uniref:GNAT family N-acetyltransferase n=1 Tax=Leisingera caerulea TaxID=506591 RepID=UPI0021A501A2|nr:GNAT family N-acetyltransferase [Leisingera caerulea]UWQ49910.1 GNAT family N-acetyltransferase [Leisingera caerulea]